MKNKLLNNLELDNLELITALVSSTEFLPWTWTAAPWDRGAPKSLIIDSDLLFSAEAKFP